jgi:hypothetical protein
VRPGADGRTGDGLGKPGDIPVESVQIDEKGGGVDLGQGHADGGWRRLGHDDSPE